ncbi:3-hydroxyacyl-ACP dehydratase FabZ [Flexivirga meconopsidis]|uniref:3-hydroxyacyl-ACP dehydratase FabZ n=1 Tax=Flexivirga meconopsidis TaxID=2977121 RepID=UPI00223FAABB|nr:3-hydroxyacyl-ACP dehydratase FabZ [Flexivirga meconopsidis]
MSGRFSYGADQLLQMLPHRWPMLMLDKAYDVEPGRSGRGVKNVTISEPHFAGHYPTHSIMPGVLIVEAMAQLVAVVYISEHLELSAAADDAVSEKVGYLGAINKMKFAALVRPGDRLDLTAKLGESFGSLRPVQVKAEVDGQLVAAGSLTVTERVAEQAA